MARTSPSARRRFATRRFSTPSSDAARAFRTRIGIRPRRARCNRRARARRLATARPMSSSAAGVRCSVSRAIRATRCSRYPRTRRWAASSICEMKPLAHRFKQVMEFHVVPPSDGVRAPVWREHTRPAAAAAARRLCRLPLPGHGCAASGAPPVRALRPLAPYRGTGAGAVSSWRWRGRLIIVAGQRHFG